MGTAGIAIWSRGGQSAHRARFFPFSLLFFYMSTINAPLSADFVLSPLGRINSKKDSFHPDCETDVIP